MSDATKAVFLSYASQDAEAAKRIAEALRAAGVEVWFDAEGGLEHGDEWDAKIRRQIKECVLFLPIISANTQAREEGYFRIEWELAAERAMGIASGVAFILPIIIDDTREPDALVPDRFRKVQWTRLPGGVVSAEVQARFLKLWSHRTGALRDKAAKAAPEAAAMTSAAAPSPGPAHRPAWAFGAAFAMVVGIVTAVWVAQHPGEPVKPAPAPPQAETPTPAAPARLAEKTLAVLAFANLSDDKGNDSFSDGVSEQLLDVLAKVPGLRVTARTSAFHFKGKDTPMPEIGRQLGVTYVVEGSVRRSGGQVRIAVQLVQAADGFRVWGDTLTRDARDAFAVQDEIAALVAQNLQLTLGLRAGGGRAVNPEAQQLVLEAARAWAQRDAASLDHAERLLQRALELQPELPRALALMAFVAAQRTDGGILTALTDADRAVLTRAQGWADRALAADPDLAEAHAVQGSLHTRFGRRNEAVAAYRKSIQLDPNYATAHQLLARYYFIDGWFDEGLAEMRRAAELDPLATRILDNLGIFLSGMGREAEALAVFDRALLLKPDNPNALLFRATALSQLGRHDEALAAFARLLTLGVDPSTRVNYATALVAAGRRADAEAQLAFTRAEPFFHGMLLCLLGRPAEGLPLIRPAGDVQRGYLLGAYRYLPRDNPEFQRRLAEWGLAEAWQRMIAWRQKNDAESLKTALPGSALDLERKAAAPPAAGAAVPAVAPDAKSVAVLAFANLSDDKGNEYFSDGISEELLNVLAKIPGLKVTARTSSFHFKGMNTAIPEIAQQLGVAYVVEGSVRKQGDRVRITAQLIKASDGFHVWSDTFTRDLKDIFAVQDEIAGLIAQNLQLKIGGGAAARTVDPEAYRLYLEALPEIAARTLAGFDRAEQLITRAIARDPGFVPAQAALAVVWCLRAVQRKEIDSRDTPIRRRIEDQAELAVKMGPDSAEAQAACGHVYTVALRFAEGEPMLRRAIQLNPSYAPAYLWLGRNLLGRGYIEEAITAMKRAVEVDPLSHRTLDNLGFTLIDAGRNREALGYLDQALRIRPDSNQAMAVKAQALSRMGRPSEALALIDQVDPGLDNIDEYIIEVNARAGRRAKLEALLAATTKDNRIRFNLLAVMNRNDEALDVLDKAIIDWGFIDTFLFNPLLDHLRTHPRFVAKLTSDGLTEAHARAQAWRAAHPPEKPEAKK